MGEHDTIEAMAEFINSPALFWTALVAFLIAVFVEVTIRAKTHRKERKHSAHSSRMERAIKHFRATGAKKITNDEYQEVARTSDSTATRDLKKLVELGLLKRQGRGRAVSYTFTTKKRVKN